MRADRPARASDGRLHVRQRAAGATLRDRRRERSEFRKVTYPDDRRRGLLGHGSILTLTSHGNRTSPVLRGKWVLEVLFGSPPPPPPPEVPDLGEDAEARTEGSLGAEQWTIHRASPFCSSCHNVIDPIGLALDQFDVTGAWRIKDRGVPVDRGRAVGRHEDRGAGGSARRAPLALGVV